VAQAELTASRPSFAATLCRIEDGVARVEKAVLVVAALAMIVLLLLQISTRAGLPVPLDFSDELTRVLLAWMIFVGAALATYRGLHFAVHILMQHLRFAGKWLVELAVGGIALAFMAAVAWVGIRGTVSGAVQMLPSLGVSVAWSQAAMPVGFTLMLYHTLMLLPRRLSGIGPAERQGEDPAA
jgi:TRAP-type C4-dicarboxylate transport system permease small subunit